MVKSNFYLFFYWTFPFLCILIISMTNFSTERTLWQAVILQALDDALKYNDPTISPQQSLHSWQVKGWINSRDFYDACNYANIEYTETRAVFQRVFNNELSECNRLRQSLSSKNKKADKTKYFMD